MPRRLTLLLVLLLSGCTSMSNMFGGKEKDPVVTQTVPEVAEDSSFVELMGGLAGADEAGRSALYEKYAERYIDDPSLANRLHFAMVVSTPGHHASDPIEARRILTDLLSKPRSLTDSERHIATVYLKDLEERLSLQSEIKQLTQKLAEAKPDPDNNNDAQLRAVLAENQRLQSALDEANAKLEALTTIERSIETPEDGNEL